MQVRFEREERSRSSLKQLSAYSPLRFTGRTVMSMNEVTRILNAIEQGDPRAAAQLMPLVYDELRRLAAAQMRARSRGRLSTPQRSCMRRICA